MRRSIEFVPYKGSQHYLQLEGYFSLRYMYLIPHIKGEFRRLKGGDLYGIIAAISIGWLFFDPITIRVRVAFNQKK